MDVIEAINTRRSIRKFTGEVISDENLNIILKAGFQAPSAHNYQSQEFIAIREKKVVQQISDGHKYAKMLVSAGCGIVVCGDKEKQPLNGLLVADCSASIENMLLAAHGLGLGAVWVGIHPVEAFEKLIAQVLNIPDNIIPVGMVVVGIKSEEKGSIEKYDEGKVHRDKW